MMNGYNFTERVRKVLAMAREEAVALHHPYVGTEHILLGILREGEGVALTALENLDVDPDALARIDARCREARPQRRDDRARISRIRRAPRRCSRSPWRTAREMNHAYVGTEHLLLGLLREQKGVAAQVLSQAGVTVENASAEILNILGTELPAHTVRTNAWGSNITATVSTQGLGPQYAERLRSVIAAANDVAARRSSRQVTAAHAVIALLEHGEGMANAALDSLSLKRADALSALDQLAPAGTDPIGPEDVLNRSEDLAHVLRALGAPTRPGGFVFGTQHLLLLVLQTSPEVAAVFEAQNIPYHAVRDAVTRMSG